MITVEKWEDYQIEEVLKQQQANNENNEMFNNKKISESVEIKGKSGSHCEIYNNKQSNNKLTTESVEITNNSWLKKNKFNNKATTNQHKQECKEIYLYLFNKYKEQILDTNYYGQKIKLISDLRQEQEYELLSEEEQNRLFNELMALKRI